MVGVAQGLLLVDVHRGHSCLPVAGPKRSHLLRNLAHGGQDQAPRQFRCRVGRASGMLVGRHDHAAPGAGINVDVRVHAALTDESQLVQALEQRFRPGAPRGSIRWRRSNANSAPGRSSIESCAFFLRGDQDYRTPPAEGGEMMFRALKYRKIPTVMVLPAREPRALALGRAEASRRAPPAHRRLDGSVATGQEESRIFDQLTEFDCRAIFVSSSRNRDTTGRGSGHIRSDQKRKEHERHDADLHWLAGSGRRDECHHPRDRDTRVRPLLE